MCYSAGSLDQYISPCPMCKVFAPPPNQGCPHKREKCTNRVAHPRMDVYYLTNAEVERFNGCGYCKWANYNASLGKPTSYSSNRGWPGCCREPKPNEYNMIELVEWAAVSIVHRIDIPPDVEKLLGPLRLPPMFKSPASPTGRNNSTPSKITTPTRRNTTSTPPRSTILSTKAMNTPTSTSPTSPSDRTRGSSHHTSGTHSANISRNSSSTAISSAVVAGLYSGDGSRRKSAAAQVPSPDRRAESRDSSIASSVRRSFDIENPPSSSGSRRTSSARRPAVTPATTSVSVSRVVVDSKSTTATDASTRRRSSSAAPASSSATTLSPTPAPKAVTTSPAITAKPTITAPSIPMSAATNSPPKATTSSPPKNTTNTPPKTPSPPSSRVGRDSLLAPRTRPDPGEQPTSSNSSGSSDGLSDSTVTSDGGFTDYLSDESEAELQRQAEARAVVQAQHEAEEREFKLAREQLAGVGLKPPKSWNPTNTPPTSPGLAGARPQMVVGRMSVHRQPASFGGAAVSMMQQPEARV